MTPFVFFIILNVNVSMQDYNLVSGISFLMTSGRGLVKARDGIRDKHVSLVCRAQRIS